MSFYPTLSVSSVTPISLLSSSHETTEREDPLGWILQGPQNHEATDTQSPAGTSWGLWSGLMCWHRKVPSWHLSKASADVCSLSCCPSNSGHPAPLLYRGGTNAHKAKRLLTHMQVDCTTQKKKLIPGRWFLNDGELRTRETEIGAHTTPFFQYRLVQATQTTAMGS